MLLKQKISLLCILTFAPPFFSIIAENSVESEKIIEEVIISFNNLNVEQAKQKLIEYEKYYSNTLTDYSKQYWSIKYEISKYDVLFSKSTSKEALNEYKNIYNSFCTYYKTALDKYKNSDDIDSYSREFAGLQNLNLSYVDVMQKQEQYNEALETLRDSISNYKLSQDIIEHKRMIITSSSSSKETNNEMSYRDLHNINTPESLQRKIIQIARGLYNIDGNESNKELLIKEFENYVRDYPTYFKAGLFLNLKMDLEGNIDLDKLVEIYKICEYKDTPQYNGNILGISNLLIDSERYEDALFFLKQVQYDKIENDRMAELYYGFGRAYMGLNDYKAALEYLLKVKALTNRYAGVDFYIKEILGDPEKVADNEIVRLLTEAHNESRIENNAYENVISENHLLTSDSDVERVTISSSNSDNKIMMNENNIPIKTIFVFLGIFLVGIVIGLKKIVLK